MWSCWAAFRSWWSISSPTIPAPRSFTVTSSCTWISDLWRCSTTREWRGPHDRRHPLRRAAPRRDGIGNRGPGHFPSPGRHLLWRADRPYRLFPRRICGVPPLARWAALCGSVRPQPVPAGAGQQPGRVFDRPAAGRLSRRFGSMDRLFSNGDTDMGNSHGRFVWYELMTTDMKTAKLFYANVVGWVARDASAPALSYSLFTVADLPVAGLMNMPEDGR